MVNPDMSPLESEPLLRARTQSMFINHSRAKFVIGNIKIYLQFISLLHTGKTQVVDILPQVRQELTYST